MPRLTRPRFFDIVDTFWVRAQENFRADGYLVPALLGLDANTTMTTFIQAVAEDDQAVATAHGLFPVPGPWAAHLPLIEAAFRDRRIVAAALIGEAWHLVAERAAEGLALDLRPSEHPMASEVVFCAGAWPREFAQVYYGATIDRGADGQGPARLTNHMHATGANVSAASWMIDLLPQPY